MLDEIRKLDEGPVNPKLVSGQTDSDRPETQLWVCSRVRSMCSECWHAGRLDTGKFSGASDVEQRKDTLMYLLIVRSNLL